MQESPNCHGAILVVEDDPHQLELLRLSIQSLPARLSMFAATDGMSALRQMQQIPLAQFASAISLVLLDLRLSGLHGLQLLARADALGLTAQAPFIVFTSSDSACEREQALSLGARDYVVKPLGYRPLQQLMRALYERWVVPGSTG